jgi:hypothetical protein
MVTALGEKVSLAADATISTRGCIDAWEASV